MAFTKVETEIKYPKLKEAKTGDVLVENGEYIGFQTSKMYNSKTFKFREKDSGDVIGISGGHLAFIIENNVSEGDSVRLTYSGQMAATEWKAKGRTGQPPHQFELEMDRKQEAEAVESSDSEDEVNLDSLL